MSAIETIASASPRRPAAKNHARPERSAAGRGAAVSLTSSCAILPSSLKSTMLTAGTRAPFRPVAYALRYSCGPNAVRDVRRRRRLREVHSARPGRRAPAGAGTARRRDARARRHPRRRTAARDSPRSRFFQSRLGHGVAVDRSGSPPARAGGLETGGRVGRLRSLRSVQRFDRGLPARRTRARFEDRGARRRARARRADAGSHAPLRPRPGGGARAGAGPRRTARRTLRSGRDLVPPRRPECIPRDRAPRAATRRVHSRRRRRRPRLRRNLAALRGAIFAVSRTGARSLAQHLASGGSFPGALLLTGARDGALAREATDLAAALLCPGDDPERRCDSCRRVAAGLHPDFFVVAPEGVQIRVDRVREAIVFAAGRPYEARRRVAAVLRAELLGAEAGNALLKSLEEPGSLFHWILTTSRPEALLPTIRSRCAVTRVEPPEAAERIARWTAA